MDIKMLILVLSAILGTCLVSAALMSGIGFLAGITISIGKIFSISFIAVIVSALLLYTIFTD